MSEKIFLWAERLLMPAILVSLCLLQGHLADRAAGLGCRSARVSWWVDQAQAAPDETNADRIAALGEYLQLAASSARESADYASLLWMGWLLVYACLSRESPRFRIIVAGVVLLASQSGFFLYGIC